MKKIVIINDKIFVFNFKTMNTEIFSYEGKLNRIDLTISKDREKYENDITNGIIQICKNDILQKIKKGEYKDSNNFKKDLVKSLKNTKIKGLDTNIENKKEFQDTLKELNAEFDKQNITVEEKKQIIEDKLDIDLKNLFHSHGINEFKITDTKSAVTYEKNGIPHVLTHTDPNTNIYEIVLRSLEFDKINSKEELDKQIESTFEVEKDKFTNHDTRNTNQTKDDNIKEIVDHLRKDYGINKIYDVMPSNDPTIGESLLIDYGKGWQLLTIERDINGVINSVELGMKKNLDNEKNVTTGIQDIKTENISEDLSKEAKENQIKDILLKLYQNEQLTPENKNVIEYYSIEENFYILSEEAKEMFLQIKEIYNEPKEKKEEKTYKKELPKKEEKNAFIELTIVTFLSGLITGAFVYMILKQIV